ncbi:hypothetical protein ABZP36_034423 [Zizania latifolia]
MVGWRRVVDGVHAIGHRLGAAAEPAAKQDGRVFVAKYSSSSVNAPFGLGQYTNILKAQAFASRGVPMNFHQLIRNAVNAPFPCIYAPSFSTSSSTLPQGHTDMHALRMEQTTALLEKIMEKQILLLDLQPAEIRRWEEKFRTQMEDTRYAELLKRLIDMLLTAVVFMSVYFGYGTYIYSYQSITVVTAACAAASRVSFNSSNKDFIWHADDSFDCLVDISAFCND